MNGAEVTFLCAIGDAVCIPFNTPVEEMERIPRLFLRSLFPGQQLSDNGTLQQCLVCVLKALSIAAEKERFGRHPSPHNVTFGEIWMVVTQYSSTTEVLSLTDVSLKEIGTLFGCCVWVCV